MDYYILSYSHKNTDIATREKLSLDIKNPKTAEFLKDLVSNKFITEAVILSTCNRIEFILNVQNSPKAEEFLLDKLSVFSGIALENLKEHADSYENVSAIHHLFSVASSLDSLVVGETQIAGQLKSAFKFSYEAGCCGLYLSRAIHFAFRCAASVRNSTSISQNSVSVASTAVAKAKEILGSLEGREALVIGAGEMSAICAKHLASANCAVILINRDFQNAENICKSVIEGNQNAKIRVESFKDIGKYINTIPLLFSATGAPHTIITLDMVVKKDWNRYWFDLAMPRDIAHDIMDVQGNVQIFAVDDLEDIVRKNLALREEQARIAYGIVGRCTQEFFNWLQTLNVEPLIKTIRALAKDSALKELQKGIIKGYLPKDYEKNIEKTLHNAFNTFLHRLTINLKSVSNTPKGDSVVESLRFLFGEESEDKMLESYKCEYAQDRAISQS
ncbi:glutamyl-tRNA reductase [Helicobacter turcicus]|uniref:Glutamyl-tRNA reductase n=1 Tax=Helicobacter turcicus TaxID=2867412 RepID=A0ABS7JN06_9HELI|nr:glutamyl-tRNA reductase [Helicobacter turcicus]MBX7490755.1 glutamyl-tRNA reductase [Helicobacter turcicus]MBX7545636.1 glutamyl-tRNA reductase [Helicobacter turcicus]